jgi:D-ribose pyranose/furanose isomerase RbsD
VDGNVQVGLPEPPENDELYLAVTEAVPSVLSVNTTFVTVKSTSALVVAANALYP